MDSNPKRDSARFRAAARNCSCFDKTSHADSARAAMCGVSSFHGFAPYGTTQPASSPTNSLSAPESKPATGNPQASASITELGHGGLTSAQYIKCDERARCGISSRGMTLKNFTLTLLFSFACVAVSTFPATTTSTAPTRTAPPRSRPSARS